MSVNSVKGFRLTDGSTAKYDYAYLENIITDTELTQEGVAADGKAVGDAIDELEAELSDLETDLTDVKSDLNDITGYAKLIYANGYIDCNQTTIDITDVVSSTSFKYLVDSCQANDLYIINGKGSLQAQSWCFVDATGLKLSSQPSSNDRVCDREIIIAPSNSAYLISNYRVSQSVNPYCIKKIYDTMALLAINMPVLSQEYASVIPNNSDLNTYRTVGNYKVETSTVADTLSNIPAPYGGRLTVSTLASANTYIQTYETTTGLKYWRTGNGTSWNAWKEVLNNVTPKTLDYAFTSGLSSSADFNTIRTIGNYRVGSATTAQGIANIPAPYGGRLTVSTLASANTYMQTYETTTGLKYWRTGNATSWNVWKEVADEISLNPTFLKYTDKGMSNLLNALMSGATYNIRFANAVKPIDLINYVGNTQNVHPKVLYFENGFSGHKYWMAYTPYPRSQDIYENPCVAYSDDGLSWKNISANPLSDPNGDGYNSDTHLVYRSDTSTLECWYRYVSDTSVTPVTERICRRTTTDGVTWTAEETLYETSGSSYANILSPSVIWNGTRYMVWCVRSNVIDFYSTDTDGKNWTLVRTIELSFDDDGLTVAPWHIDVIYDNDTYVLLAMCRNGATTTNNRCSLFISTSSNNSQYTTPYKVISGDSGNWDNYMYRSSIVKVAGKYRIYYSAGTGGATSIYGAMWGMGIAESATLSNFIGLYV